MDKFKAFVITILLIFILFFTLFAPHIVTKMILSIVLLIFTIIVYKVLKKKKTISIHQKHVTILMSVLAVTYISIYYMLGLYFGFQQAKITFSVRTLFKFIIPLSIIIISAEWLRNRLLQQEVVIRIKSKKLDLSPVMTYIAMVLIDLTIYTDIYDLTNIDDFLTVLGFVLFASLSCNLLYNYITARYGAKGIIIYRLITTLYLYVIPIVPDVYIFLRVFLRMISPYVIYVVLEKACNNTVLASYNQKKESIVSNAILLTIMILLVMLISCQFHFGLLVIGSHSMTGTLNKGDAVIFEKYTNQEIAIGQVIIFNNNGIQTIHRVIDIQLVNGNYRYTTQGDANTLADSDYITSDDIYGLVKLRIKYIGYPTLWVREWFS